MVPCDMPMNESNKDLRLRKLLHELPGNVPLPPRFQEHVWQRIATAERAVGAKSAFSLTVWLDQFFCRPAFATACIVALLGAGTATGYFAGGRESVRLESQFSQHYAASINPYLADPR